MPRACRWVVAAVRCLAASCIAAGPAAAEGLAPLVTDGHVTPPWHLVGLPKQTKPFTQFAPETAGGRAALRIDADRSYGNLVHPLAGVAPTQHLRWSWRLQQGNAAADLHQRGGDDTPAKVCVAFDLPLDSVPFTDRQLLRLARSNSADPLPAATLCYVWSQAEAHGTRIDSAFTRRLRYVVLRNGEDASATWFDESRDIAADFKRSFGDESPNTVPALVAVVVGADADNTSAHSVAHVTALRLEP